VSVTLLYGCDDCDEELHVTIEAPRALCTPDGWLSWRSVDDWKLACPRCARLRRQIGWDVPADPVKARR
jgi:hypothetical protein